jgi:hypothetical protein
LVVRLSRNCLHMPDRLVDTYAKSRAFLVGIILVRLIRATICASGWR